MNSNGSIFAQSDDFWSTYLRGRPRVPDSFFTRILDYHRAKRSSFGVVHDVGAGVGPYSQRLRTHFDHVIVSDIVPENIRLAQQRLLSDPSSSSSPSGYTFRVSSIDQADDIATGSVDLIFATNVMHFAEPQDTTVAVLARQLSPGGTFAAALFGPANFDDDQLQDLWRRISQSGGRKLLSRADHPELTKRVMARTEGKYNVAPLSTEWFEEGAQRVHLNMGKAGERGIQGMLPSEEKLVVCEPDYTGPKDVETFVEDKEWDFETDLAGVKEHFSSFPFVSQFPEAFVDLYAELDRLIGDKKVRGTFPVKIILGTRRSD